jgi:hypothetical protein
METEMKKQYRDFESAREFVRSLGLKSNKEWKEYCKSGDKPDNIPSAPNTTYKKEWKGVGDWLGTGRIADNYRVYPSFKEAREFVRNLKFKNQKEWKKYCKSGDRPDDISANPNRTYKKEWKGFGDWLGTGTVAPQDKVYRLYKEARKFVHTLKIKKKDEWYDYCKSGDKPNNIPASPYTVYKNKGWINWGDFLGNGKLEEFFSFREAREFVQKLELTGQKDWNEYVKSGKRSNHLPAAPWSTYKKEWTNMGDFFGTGTVAPKDRVYRPFKEAREFVRSLGIKNYDEWYAYCKSGNKPDDIPSNPWRSYKEWKKK